MWAWGTIEADFQRYYNININQLGFSNQISWRRFLSLVRGLPIDSAWYRWNSDKNNRRYAEWVPDAIDIDI